jgi:hypothetical protein
MTPEKHLQNDLPAVVPSAASTTTAAAAAAISAIASTAASATAGAFSFGTGFVHVDGASADLRAVERSDGFLAVFVAGHFDESEAAGASGLAVRHNTYAVHLTITLKQLPEFVFVGIEAEVPHENIFHAYAPALSCQECELSSANLAGREGLS